MGRSSGCLTASCWSRWLFVSRYYWLHPNFWIPLSLHMLYYSMGMGLMLDWKVGSTSSRSWTLQVHETKIWMLGLYSLSFFLLWMVKSVLIVKYLLSYCSQMYDFLVYSLHPALPLLLHLLGHTNSRCNFSLPFFAKLIMIIMIYWLVFRIHFYFLSFLVKHLNFFLVAACSASGGIAGGRWSWRQGWVAAG
jgi:hypothetical protein